MEGFTSATDQQSMVSSFLEIAVGQTADTARQFLQATHWKLEEAIQLFFVGNEGGAVAQPSFSIPVENDRPLPDQSLGESTKDVVEENVRQDDGNEVRAPLPVKREILYDHAMLYGASRTGDPSHEARPVVPFRNFNEEMKRPGIWGAEQGATSTTDQSRVNLASMYRPPFALMYHGPFEKTLPMILAYGNFRIVYCAGGVKDIVNECSFFFSSFVTDHTSFLSFSLFGVALRVENKLERSWVAVFLYLWEWNVWLGWDIHSWDLKGNGLVEQNGYGVIGDKTWDVIAVSNEFGSNSVGLPRRIWMVEFCKFCFKERFTILGRRSKKLWRRTGEKFNVVLYPFEAKDAAKVQDKWLLVNLQSTREFSSHMLNRDTWGNEAVAQTIRTNFIFWQVSDDTEEGSKVCTYYKLDSAPVILVIDPVTGQKMRSWRAMIQPESLLEDLLPFMDGSPKDHHVSLSHKRPRETSQASPPKTQVEEGMRCGEQGTRETMGNLTWEQSVLSQAEELKPAEQKIFADLQLPKVVGYTEKRSKSQV
ncbi:unnamed protein product [Ilex paraguariensis]|uniref:UAS domain-containing protein n=1 Tax=Ilex paraguariensis TaxID=185542 RepID=A0ABC8RI80_9AQUA